MANDKVKSQGNKMYVIKASDKTITIEKKVKEAPPPKKD